MVDLTGLELSEEQTAKISALFDTEIGGLKNKVDELIGEKRNVQQTSTEKDQIIDDARKAAAKAHEETLIAAGKTDELKAFYEEQLATTTAELTATAKTAKDGFVDSDIDSYHMHATRLRESISTGKWIPRRSPYRC